MKSLFFTFLVILLLFGCRTIEEVRAEATPNRKRYAIGQGGGLAGDYSEFILSENGQVHKYDFRYEREVYFKDLAKADLIYFLEKIEALGLEGIEMNYPGNTSKYIDLRYGKSSINKIVWGHYNYRPDEELIKLHKELYKKMSTWD